VSANLHANTGPFKRIELFCLPFNSLTMEDAVAAVEQFVVDRRPKWVTVANAAVVVWTHGNAELQTLISSADLILCDGMGLMYASRLLGVPFPEMLSGPLMLDRLVRLAAERGYSIFLLGTKRDILQRAVANYQGRYATLRISGYRDGYFAVEEEVEVVEQIRDSHPDILFVAMGTPREETFVRDHLEDLEVPVCLDVGGAFDVAAGTYRLAPVWLRVLALEWFYRLIQEPGRLWRRYLTTNTVFLWLVLKALVTERLSAGKRMARPRSRQHASDD
jgi:N-acetylglucosaminyldiphosphoundecaprenol N-acetyl-beta-D-mannosaminyltransferase